MPLVVGAGRDRDAGEALLPDRGVAAGEAADSGNPVEHAARGGAIAGVGRSRRHRERSGCIGFELARPFLEILVPVLAAERERQRLGEADLEFACNVQIGGPLAEPDAARIHVARPVRPERGVDAVERAIVDLVVAIDRGQVDVPRSRLALHAAGQRIIVILRIDVRQETVGIDRDKVRRSRRGRGRDGRIVTVGRGR